MATGSDKFPTMHPVEGFQLGTTSAGIKVAGRKDLVLMKIADGSTAAAVFTQNRFCAAPVIIAKQHLQQTTPSYLLVNTGNANAGTGEQGIADSLSCCHAVAEAANIESQQVLPFSTGVIGEPLPVDTICSSVAAAKKKPFNQWLARCG